MIHTAQSGYRTIPVVARTYLPPCACGARHPLAYQPPAPDGVCPECGAATTQGRTETSEAVLAGNRPVDRLTRALFWTADKLNRLAKRI